MLCCMCFVLAFRGAIYLVAMVTGIQCIYALKKGSDRGVWWHILIKLQQDKKLQMNVVLADSTTIKIHRHGGGLKGGFKAEGEALAE